MLVLFCLETVPLATDITEYNITCYELVHVMPEILHTHMHKHSVNWLNAEVRELLYSGWHKRISRCFEWTIAVCTPDLVVYGICLRLKLSTFVELSTVVGQWGYVILGNSAQNLHILELLQPLKAIF